MGGVCSAIVRDPDVAANTDVAGSRGSRATTRRVACKAGRCSLDDDNGERRQMGSGRK